MAQNDDERLLALIESDTADAGLPPGYCWGKPIFMMGGPANLEYVTTRRGNKVTKVLSPASRALLKACEGLRFEVLDVRRQPDLALQLWEARSLALHEAQEKTRRENAIPTAAPVADKGVRPLRVIRV